MNGALPIGAMEMRVRGVLGGKEGKNTENQSTLVCILLTK